MKKSTPIPANHISAFPSVYSLDFQKAIDMLPKLGIQLHIYKFTIEIYPKVILARIDGIWMPHDNPNVQSWECVFDTNNQATRKLLTSKDPALVNNGRQILLEQALLSDIKDFKNPL